MSERMMLSDLIQELTATKKECGDLPVTVMATRYYQTVCVPLHVVRVRDLILGKDEESAQPGAPLRHVVIVGEYP